MEAGHQNDKAISLSRRIQSSVFGRLPPGQRLDLAGNRRVIVFGDIGGHRVVMARPQKDTPPFLAAGK